MSTALNCGLAPWGAQAATAEAASVRRAVRRSMVASEIVVDEQRREQRAQVDQRKAKGLACERVRVLAPEPEAMPGKAGTQHQCRGEVQPGTHAVRKGH